MRILLTGCTGIQVQGKRRRKNTYISLYHVLYPALQALGHEVDWRPVKCGERDLASRYDLALVGVAAMHGFVTMNYKWGALWAASQLPHAVTFDDWQVEGVCKTIRDSSLWSLGVVDYVAYQDAYKFREQVEGQRARWAERMDHVLAPLFNWGHWDKFTALHPMGQLHGWDPSPHIEMPEMGPLLGKKRRWVCAALANKDPWLKRVKPTWEVERRFNGGLPRLEEEKLVTESYASAWGVLSPAYRAIDGAGWWRARYNWSAHARCVLWGEPAEMEPLGDQFHRSLEEIEGLGDYELMTLAEDQANWLWEDQLDEAGSLAELQSALEAIASR